MVSPGAANRDPRAVRDPHEFHLDRKNVREHIAFSRGIHSCPGAPLARVEGRVSIERILDRMAGITIDEEKHGPANDRRYTYEPTFILRGLTDLNIKFTPSWVAVPRRSTSSRSVDCELARSCEDNARLDWLAGSA